MAKYEQEFKRNHGLWDGARKTNLVKSWSNLSIIYKYEQFTWIEYFSIL